MGTGTITATTDAVTIPHRPAAKVTIQTNGITPAVRLGGTAHSPASTAQVSAIASTSAIHEARPPVLNPSTATVSTTASPTGTLVTDVKALLGTLIEAYQAICFSGNSEAARREIVMALVTSWRRRIEREAIIRRADYGSEMTVLVKEVVGQIKRTVGENPAFVIEFLSKKAQESAPC